MKNNKDTKPIKK